MPRLRGAKASVRSSYVQVGASTFLLGRLFNGTVQPLCTDHVQITAPAQGTLSVHLLLGWYVVTHAPKWEVHL